MTPKQCANHSSYPTPPFTFPRNGPGVNVQHTMMMRPSISRRNVSTTPRAAALSFLRTDQPSTVNATSNVARTVGVVTSCAELDSTSARVGYLDEATWSAFFFFASTATAERRPTRMVLTPVI